ncbi:MAG: adenylate/guanylate cyclase domain-containing protein [Candidatus Tectomicrobia bacterium]|uniref:Adenylate/guanylate cyclase domain-containing protein n=1 Tax=Tectimicrobiota bacterium TaxID=2528274 RepID=A0A937VYW1_UNCTE|nr:adenylate/guanylate cyclase domain-containing protein [Candidatus Tectomicrobia bacterium]
MNFKFKSKKFLRFVGLLEAGLLASVLLFWFVLGQVWTSFDSQVADVFYAQAVRYGYGPPRSPRIVYVTITDDSYEHFGTRVLDRVEMARVNEALAELGAAAVAYDLVFPLASTAAADERFTASLQRMGTVYLPVAADQSAEAQPFQWGPGLAYERLRAQLRPVHERGVARPLFATRTLMQYDPFAAAALKTAHISATNDPDGVYRHLPLLLKLDAGYLPAMSLAMFLDAVNIPLEALTVTWGEAVTIPALPGSGLTHDLSIPIDAHGRALVPYPQKWGQDFPAMSMQRLLQLMDEPDMRGNLQDFFEGKYVVVGDVSTGIADAGQTSLDRYVPLVAMHTAFMNALLTQTFMRTWSPWQVIGLIAFISLVVGFAALLESPMILYTTGGCIVVGLAALAWVQCLHGMFVPLATVLVSFLWVFFGLVIGLGVAIARDQAFIRNTFAKYVSEKVVNELLQHPERIQLGGEERVLSVLFSDIADFTTFSERLKPQALVKLLNEYLTEMTNIVMEQGGIIDKYIGDAIMAEFGAPIPIAHHADLAVRTAMRMQHRLAELRLHWIQQGLPELHCRVGINTGSMVVGNVGSNQVFNYTAVGDAVNLASRLEGANKHYKTMVMISEFTYQALTPGLFRTRLLDAIRVKGKSQAVKVYEVYGEVSDCIAEADLQYYQAYDAAFVAYLERRFDEAHAQFTAALAIRPGDTSALEMLARLADLDPDALPEHWDGVTTFETK